MAANNNQIFMIYHLIIHSFNEQPEFRKETKLSLFWAPVVLNDKLTFSAKEEEENLQIKEREKKNCLVKKEESGVLICKGKTDERKGWKLHYNTEDV